MLHKINGKKSERWCFFYKSFVSTRNSICVIHNSRWRGLKRIETWRNWALFLSLPRYNPKMPKILKRIAFPGKIYLVLLLLVYKKYCLLISQFIVLEYKRFGTGQKSKGISLSYYREETFFFLILISTRAFFVLFLFLFFSFSFSIFFTWSLTTK